MRRILFAVSGILFLTACQEKEFLTPEVGETTIVKNRKVEDLHFPFADLEELNQFKNLNNVVHYEMARKIALLELQATGFVQELEWVSLIRKTSTNL